jgi:predicted metal-dependent peptidase
MKREVLDNTLAAMFSNLSFRQSYLFYAHIIGQCSIKLDESMKAPAGVCFVNDHYDLYINPLFFDEYKLEGRLAILKHEMLHILNDHIHRVEDRNFKTWNYSTDCAINQLIDRNHLPECGITPKTLSEELDIDIPVNLSSEQYYDLIVSNVKDENKDSSESSESSDSSDSSESSESSESMDDHETWKESKGDKDLQKDLTKKMIEHAQTETIKYKGTVPNNISDWMEIHSSPSEVNWKKILRNIVGNKRVGSRPTIMKKNRRFPKRDDLRGKTKDRTFNLLVVADVSGSMSDKAVLSTLGEVRHICDITKTSVDLIQIDTEAYTPEKLEKSTKLIERKGNGGTRLSPALDKAKEFNIDYQAVVVLTDGGLWENDILQFKNLKKKVIWLIEPKGDTLPEMNSGLMKAIKLKGKK